MGNAKLKSQSGTLLKDAKNRQAVYMKAMPKTEDQMTPVLNSFREPGFILET
jgi:hypothetical protein